MYGTSFTQLPIKDVLGMCQQTLEKLEDWKNKKRKAAVDDYINNYYNGQIDDYESMNWFGRLMWKKPKHERVDPKSAEAIKLTKQNTNFLDHIIKEYNEEKHKIQLIINLCNVAEKHGHTTVNISANDLNLID